MRGPLGCIPQISIFSGALLCFTLGFWTPDAFQDKIYSNYWRFMFSLPAIVAAIQLILIKIGGFSHEAPQFCLLHGKEQEARQMLVKIY
jgi:Sugar (and other) transporter